MGNIYFASDLHLGHVKVAKLRGFDSVDHHDSTILDNLHQANRPGDTWYLLGDLVMGDSKVHLLGGLSKVFDGSTVHVILGNHDRAHPCNRNGHLRFPDWMNLFHSVSTATSIRFGGKTYLLSHFPYDGDSGGPDRYTQWRLRDEGAPLIHGHVHDDVKYRLSKNQTPMFHCGLDAWNFHPVNAHDLLTV